MKETIVEKQFSEKVKVLLAIENDDLALFLELLNLPNLLN